MHSSSASSSADLSATLEHEATFSQHVRRADVCNTDCKRTRARVASLGASHTAIAGLGHKLRRGRHALGEQW